MSLYMNGTLVAQQYYPGLTFRANNQPFNIGVMETYGYYFNGFIDEVAVYNYSLSPDQIQTHYFAGTSQSVPEPGSIAFAMAITAFGLIRLVRRRS
jgi:hypothetical protein